MVGGTATINDRLGDFWKYNPYTGLWVRMGGSTTGNVWVFGGYGYGNQQFSCGKLNDMWMVSY